MVFDQVGVPGADGALVARELLIVLALGTRGGHEGGDRFAGGEATAVSSDGGCFFGGLDFQRRALKHGVVVAVVEYSAGQNHLVGFVARGAVLVGAGASSIEEVLDLSSLDSHACGATEHDRGNTRAV